MLKAENRLKKQAEFSETMKAGARFNGRYLTFFTKTGTKVPRAGFIVTKKITKKAVDRNRLRRILAHLFRHVFSDNKITADVVVLVRARPDQAIFQEYEKDVHQWLAASSPR